MISGGPEIEIIDFGGVEFTDALADLVGGGAEVPRVAQRETRHAENADVLPRFATVRYAVLVLFAGILFLLRYGVPVGVFIYVLSQK